MTLNLQDESSKSIGDRTIDTYQSNTIYGKSISLEKHIHSAMKVYPTLADGVTITGAVAAWTLGTIVEIVPASTITDNFDIHWLIIEEVSANDRYEIVLYSGGAGSEVEIGRQKTVRNTTAGNGVISIPFQTEIIAANSRISAAIASKSGGSDTMDISIGYHEY